jgi:multicomponent Na+:H+ antiporter subunit E
MGYSMSKFTDLKQSSALSTSWLRLGLDFWIRVALFSVSWLILTGWQPNSWAVGAVSIIMASILSLQLTVTQEQAKPWQINPKKLISCLYYFFVQSLRGGWDIAKLALMPKSKLSPGEITYHTTLVTESHILTLMHLLSLLPGTVSAKRCGCEITIHVLNLNSFNSTEIDDCQMLISELFCSQTRLFSDKGTL